MRRGLAALVLGLVFWVAAGGQAGEEPGWYRVFLKNGEALTARLAGADRESYLLSVEGTAVKVARSDVKRLERLPGQGAPPPPGHAAPGTGASDHEPPPTVAPEAPRAADRSEARFLDAVEGLSRSDDAAVARAYSLLAADVRAARPVVHRSLGHPSPRVRRLLTKLLGERGEAKSDLKAVSGQLSDDDSTVRLAAIVALRRYGPVALPALLARLPAEPAPGYRKMIARAAAGFGDARAVSPLIAHLQIEGDGGTRASIGLALEALTGENRGADPGAWAAYLSGEETKRTLRQMKPEAPPQKSAR